LCNRVTTNDDNGLEVTHTGADRVTSCNHSPDDENSAALFNERAAILEYDGNYPPPHSNVFLV
jgi:hypothetical protein